MTLKVLYCVHVYTQECHLMSTYLLFSGIHSLILFIQNFTHFIVCVCGGLQQVLTETNYPHLSACFKVTNAFICECL